MKSTTTGNRARWYTAHADPIWADHRNRLAGRVLAMCATTQKAIALGLGNSEGWVSRLVHGDPSVGLHLERVESLASFSATDAGPLAAAPFGALNRVLAEDLSDRDAVRALELVLQRETDLEGIENSVQVRRLLADADSLDADEVGAIEDELAEAFLRSMAAEAVALGILWERKRRRARRAH